MRLIIIIIGFAITFTYLFNLQNELFVLRLLPLELYQYPQSRFTKHEMLAFKLILGWLIPILIATIFIFKAQIHKRLTLNYGFTLIAIAVVIFLLRLIVLYLTTFIQGGGATFVTAYYFGYIALPLKLMLVIGSLKLLMTLKPMQNQ